MKINENKVVAIIVTYHPELKRFERLLKSMASQVKKIYVVSNSNDELDRSYVNFEHIQLKQNMGIAYAQNVGINKALEDGADFILTSDQDTVYPENYVDNLLKCFYDKSISHKIAAVGPAFRDLHKENKIQQMVHFGSFYLKKEINPSECFKSSHIISSGMIIPSEAIKTIGLMRDDFFIDWVDSEWCWRALSKGYVTLQDPGTVIDHAIGDESKKILFKNLTVHSTFRNYYKLRNVVYMLIHSEYLSFPIKNYLFVSIFKISISSIITTKNFKKEIKTIFYAIIDGMFKNMGNNRNI